jgi:predicted PurR-regulated permease PerM
VIIAFSAFVTGAGWLLFDSIAGEFAQLAADLPRAFDRLTTSVGSSAWGGWLVRQIPSLENVDWSGVVWRNGGILPKTLGATLAALSGLVVVLFVGIYFAAQPNVYRRGLLHLIPVSKRSRVEKVLREVGTTLHWWMAGQAFAMVLTAALTVIGLQILGVDLSLALGALAGVLTFVPYIGPALAFIPAALIALLGVPSMVLWVAGLYIGIQTLESYVLTPSVHQKTISCRRSSRSWPNS